MKEIKQKKLAYLAGLVDGDGSICIRDADEKGCQLTLYVYSNFVPLHNWLVHNFGGDYRPIKTEGNRKQKYAWYTSKGSLVKAIAPYLVIKKQQGIAASSFVDLGSERNPEARKELLADLQTANQSFVPVTHTNVGTSISPTKLDFAYLAGIFDAEGSFSIFKRGKVMKNGGRYTSLARVSNTDNRIFPWLLSRFGGGYCRNKREDRDEGCWSMTGPNREYYLLAMLPYLITKRERGIVLLQWIRENGSLTLEAKEDRYKLMKKLNFRGLSPETNTSRLPEQEDKIESDLTGDSKCAPLVTAVA